MLIMCYIILVFYHCLILIDLRKLRFYHAKYTAASVGGIDCIVWHSLTATSKRTVGILRPMAEYRIFHFASDAIYLTAVWTKFAELLF